MRPLLAFSSHAREAAFVRRFHTARLPLDVVNCCTIMGCNLALVLLKMAPHGRWNSAALLLLDALAAATLLGLLRFTGEWYLRHRSPIIAALHLGHAVVSHPAQVRCWLWPCVRGCCVASWLPL